MHINVLLYSINLYDTSTSLREQIYYKPIFIVIAVFTMDGQYHFSRIKLNPHFLRGKVCAHQSLEEQSDQGLFVNMFWQINH